MRRTSLPRRRLGITIAAALAVSGVLATAAAAQLPTTNDPRATLSPGLTDAGTAAKGLALTANLPKQGTFAPSFNSDLALQGKYAFVGSFNGFQIYDISNPAAPTLQTAVICPGGQGDVSVYGNLLFMSVESAPGRVDCSTATGANARGIRIFDISNIAAPQQVAVVQTCRGSHTHTLVTDADDAANVYVYVSGTGGVRSDLAGCVNSTTGTTTPNFNEQASHWRIEVIKVPLAAPQDAAIVNGPRLFRDSATGALNGLQNRFNGDGTTHPSGTAWSPTPNTNHCHDITVYPETGLAAGACSGNGLLIDISDPANPVRIDAVADPNYAYWHGATFSNDGTKVMFTDEWGGGTAPRCRATDNLAWGANAIYEIVDRKLVFRSYYKLPVVQTNQENCVAHIPSVVPVPGRDVFVQAWYQGGASLVDWTDAANPKEIGYFDRGPISGTTLVAGGLWSTYWYNGHTYGSEIARGFDVYSLTPTGDLSSSEIAAARSVQVDRLNAQHQERFAWVPSIAVIRSYRDQLVRANAIDAATLEQVDKFVDRAERFEDGPQAQAAKATLQGLANQLEGTQYDGLRGALRAYADA
jgi:hypothetical protein